MYSEPLADVGMDDCFFYHSIDLPQHGFCQGAWDLREVTDQYLGHQNIHGKSVLEIGCANGFLTFSMENAGAKVTGFDLPPDGMGDFFHAPGSDPVKTEADFKSYLRRLRNAFWLGHKANESEAKLVEGNVYNIDESLGEYDIATIGVVLLHLRDPFLALQKVLPRVKEKIIITEAYYRYGKLTALINKLGGGRRPGMHFVPHPTDKSSLGTWWFIPPETMQRFLELHGFTVEKIEHFTAPYHGKPARLYTIVASRS